MLKLTNFNFYLTATICLACVQTSPISFVPFPRATKEIGDVCTQATICPKAGARPLPKNAKLPLSVYVFSSKKPFLKLPVNNYSAKGSKAFGLTHRDL